VPAMARRRTVCPRQGSPPRPEEQALTAVPAPVHVDQDVVDDIGRLLAATKLMQLKAVVFWPEIGGDGPAAVGGRRTAQADLDGAPAVGVGWRPLFWSLAPWLPRPRCGWYTSSGRRCRTAQPVRGRAADGAGH
jgi:hypothetical protein